MKKLIVITYQLSPFHNYAEFYDRLKELCPDYQHFLEDTWLVYTDVPIDTLYDELLPLMHIQEGSISRLFICEMGHEFKGFAQKSLWPWIRKRQS